MTSNKEKAQTEILLEVAKNQSEIEEKDRVLALVTQTLPSVNQVGRAVANKLWKISPNLVQQLTEEQIIVAGRETLRKTFRRDKTGVLGLYEPDLDRLWINLDVLSEYTTYLKKHIRPLRLKTEVDTESLVLFYTLSHEGIVHRWCLDKKITVPRSRSLLKKFGKEVIAPRMLEPIPSSSWDRMNTSTSGCKIIYKEPGGNSEVTMGREINEVSSRFFTLDLAIPFLMDRYGFDEKSSFNILTPLFTSQELGSPLFVRISQFRKEIGEDQFANLYFGGDFYTNHFSRLDNEELTTLFKMLLDGYSGFFDEYLKKRGG